MADTQSETEDHEARTEDERAQGLLTRELNSALTVIKGRTQLLRRRLRQGDDTARLETDLEAIERELARLTTIVQRINRGGAGS
jgi:signal transduction histidine kinase